MIMPPPVDAADALIRGGSQRLRVLFVGAAPVLEQEPLHLRREWQNLCQELTEGTLPSALVRLLPPSRETLVATLNRAAEAAAPVHVLHFAGHGEPDHLLFETPLSAPFRYSGDALANDLRGRGVRLVFLNACKTASKFSLPLASALVASGAIDAAIGHTSPVGDDAALLFSSRLYRNLCEGERLRDAFMAAQQAVAAKFPATAEEIRLFGDGNLQFTDSGAGTSHAAFSFDGNFGRRNMPEAPLHFGRSEELLTLGRFFEAPDKLVLTLSGLGGIGKTALALEAAARHAWRFPGGQAFSSAHSQEPGGPSASSLLSTVMDELMPPLAPEEKSLQRLFAYLQDHPGLLIFDQLETLESSELHHLLSHLEQLPPNGSKAILTLRTAPPILRGWPWLQAITLTAGLSPQVGSAYVLRAARGKVPEWSHAGDLDERDRNVADGLAQALAGHPMLLDVAVDVAATESVRALNDALEELSRLDGAVARGPFTEAIGARMDMLLKSVSSALNADGRWVLSFFPCSPDGTFTRDELHAAARGAERAAGRLSSLAGRVTAGLAACFKAGLVEHELHSDFYRVHPAVRWHVSWREPRRGTDIHLELIEHCLAYVATRLHDHAALERRLPFLLGVFDWAWKVDATAMFQQPILSAMNQMSVFLMERARVLPGLSDWIARLEEKNGEPLARRAERLRRQSEILFAQGQIDESKKCIRESIDCYRKVGVPAGLAVALEHFAHVSVHQGNFHEARHALIECLKLLRTVNDPATEVAVLYDLADIEMREGHIAEARAILTKALEKQKAADPIRGQARIGAMMMMLGISATGQGNAEEASEFLRKGELLTQGLGDALPQVASLLIRATGEAGRGNYVKARELVTQAASLRMPDGRIEGKLVVLLARAALEQQQGQYSEAHQTLSEALELFPKDAHSHFNERAKLLNQLAGLHISQGRFDQARQCVDKSMQLQKQVGDSVNRACSLRYLSMLEQQKGDYARARAYAEEALALDTALGYHMGRPNSLYQLGLIKANMGEDAKAEEHLRESLRLMDSLNSPRSRAAPLIVLAQVATRQDRRDEARKHLQEVITLLDGTSDPQIHVARNLLMKLEGPQAKPTSPTYAIPPWLPVLISQAQEAIKLGQPEMMIERIRAALITHGNKDGPGPLAELHALESELLAVSGRLLEAEEAFGKGEAIAGAAGLHELTQRIQQLRRRMQHLDEQRRVPGT